MQFTFTIHISLEVSHNQHYSPSVGEWSNDKGTSYDTMRGMNKSAFPLYIISLLLVSLACSITSEPPPTLAPSTPVIVSTITPETAIEAPPLQVTANPIAVPTTSIQSQANVVYIPTSLEQVDPNRMMADIQTLVSFQSRHILSTPNTTTGSQAAQTFLIDTLKGIAATSPNTFLQIDVYPHQFEMEWAGQTVYPANVVMSIQGTDASAGVVMVTAHYDTALQNWFDGDSYQPGANDNGSGVAAILEMARILVQKPHRATIVLVLFTAEETGRQGSQAFVQQFIQAQNIPLIAQMNLDMVGNPSGRSGDRNAGMMRIFSEGPNDASPSRQLARLAQVAISRFLPTMTLQVEDRLERSGRWGDHMSFSEAGYPSVRFIESGDDPTIVHTNRDTIEKIDPTYLRQTTQAVLATLEILVDGPNPPSLRPLTNSSTDPNSLVLEWSHNPVCQSYVVALRRTDSLIFDEFYTVQATTLAWNGFRNFATVSVSCIDTEGRLGRFAPELAIPQLVIVQDN